MVIAAASFVGIVALFLGIYWLFVIRLERQAERELARRLNPNKPTAVQEEFSLLNSIRRRSSVPSFDHALQHANALIRPIERLIEQADVRATVAHVVLTSVFLFLLVALVGTLMSGELLIGVAAGVALGSAPGVILRHLAHRRLARFEEQFPEAIALIARALRAGHALTTGLGMVVDEMPDPVRMEFRLLHDRQTFGMAFPDALRGFADRIPLVDARFFVTAVLTQRETGGNLAEVLDSLAALIRERFRLRRQIRTLSAHGRITGLVLGGLPFAIGGILFVIAPEFIAQLFTDPLGLRMVGTAAVLQVIGWAAMRRIINIEI